ncbi:MAG: ester cyclase [Thermoplasmata archaeon]
MEPPSVVKTYVDAWCRYDFEAVARTFASDGVLREPASEEQPVTRDQLKDYATKIMEPLLIGFPDARWETVALNAISEKFAVWQWIFRGTNTGAFGGKPPTHRQIELPGCEVIEIADGNIRNIQGYCDLLGFHRQLGR